MSKILENLLRNSKTLVDSRNRSESPQLERELSQIASESSLLNARLNKEQSPNATAHYFLAQSGANTQEINENLNTLDTRITFQPLEKIPTNDVESYLKRVQKDIVIATVVESNRNTSENVLDVLKENLLSNGRDARRRILEEWDYERENQKFGRNVQGKDQQVETFEKKMIHYSNVIKEVNTSRLLSEKIPIIKKFKSLAQFTQCDKTQERSMLDSWDIASHLTNESNTFVFSDNGIDIVKKNQQLIHSAKSWLENEFMSFIKDILNKNAAQVKVGGTPSLKHRIHAFMLFAFSKNSIWIDDSLEVKNNIPIWLYVYLFIRSGHYDLALDFVNENPVSFNGSPLFPTYLKEYLSSPEKLVSDDHRKEILEHYKQMVYSNTVADPYKILLYKIMGRCELESQVIPTVIRTTEDYIWLELLLIRERVNEERYQFERYRLIDFQNKITVAGAKHFDPHGTNPWFYFKVLLLSLQFENAIDYLYKSEKFRLEAVHFGIGLGYYGLIRIPKEPRNYTLDLLIHEWDGSVSLNFSHLISQFVRLFVSQSSEDALHYLYLITLYQTQDMLILCREHIFNYIVRCKDYKEIIGYIEPKQGGVKAGNIEKYQSLIGIERYDNEKYRNTILYPIALKFETMGKYKDAVNVYELSERYTDAFKVLNKELDYALDRPHESQFAERRGKDMELIEFSKLVLRNYENHGYIKCDESVLNTHKMLVFFLQASIKYEEGNYEETIEIIKATNILPSSNDMKNIQLSAVKFDKYTDYSIRKHISQILVMVMESYHRLWQKYSLYNPNLNHINQISIAKIKNEASAILPFISLIEFKIPADIIIKLNKNELFSKCI